MATKYNDMFKKFSDLFTKNFPTADGDHFAVDVETKFKSEDITVTSKVSRGADGKSVSGSFEPEFKHDKLTVSGNFSTKQKHSATVKYAHEGATVGVTGNSERENVDVKGTFDYVDARFTIGGGITYPYAGKNPIVGVGSATFVYENLTVGGSYSTEYDTHKGLGDHECALALRHDGKDYNLGFVADKKVVKSEETVTLKGSYYQKVNEKTDAGVGFSVDTDSNANIILASLTKLDALSSLKARTKVGNTKDLNIAFVYEQRVNNLVNVSLGTDLCVSSLISGSAGHKNKFQFKVTLLD